MREEKKHALPLSGWNVENYNHIKNNNVFNHQSNNNSHYRIIPVVNMFDLDNLGNPAGYRGQ